MLVQKGSSNVMKSTHYKINRTAIPLVWLFIGILISQGPLPNFVLCIGADGHVEVEAVDRGQCASFVTETQQNASDFLPAYGVFTIQDHCGACLDLPIFMSSSEAEYIVPVQKNISQFNTFVITPSLGNPLIFTSIPAEISLLNFQPRPNFTLAFLRTVTLLI